MLIAALAAARAEFAPAGNGGEVGFDPFLKMLKQLRDSGHYAPLNKLSSPSASPRNTTPNADDNDDKPAMIDSLSSSSFFSSSSSHGPPRTTPPNADDDDDDDGMMNSLSASLFFSSSRAPLRTTPSADADNELMEA